MLALMLPNLFIGCLGALSIVLFIIVLVMIVGTLWKSGQFEDNIGWFVFSFFLFVVAFIINFIGWIAVWVGK